MPLFDATLSILEQSMNVRLDRQNLLASDLANANTPGFVAKDLDFEKQITAAANQLEGASGALAQRFSPQGSMGMPAVAPGELGMSDDGQHVASIGAQGAGDGQLSLQLPTPTMSESSPQLAVGGMLSLDQNRVDTDHAMVALAANAINYGASAKAIAKKMAILSYCANDGQG